MKIKGDPGQFSIYNLFEFHKVSSDTAHSNKTIKQISIVPNSTSQGEKDQYNKEYNISSINSNHIYLPRIREQKLDTGAQVTVARNNTNMSISSKIIYTNSNPCPVHLSSASGNHMDISAKGVENKLVGNTYISDVDTDLISGPALQRNGYWIILPPTNNRNDNIGGIILKPNDDHTASIVNIIDTDMMFDVNSTGNYRIDTNISQLDSLINKVRNMSSIINGRECT